MSESAWKDRATYALWFVILPLGLALAVPQILARAKLIDEAAPWMYLLAFAVLELAMLALRGTVLGGSSKGPRTIASVRADAKELRREAEKLLKRVRADKDLKQQFDEQFRKVDAALESLNVETSAAEVATLDRMTEKHLGKARKSTAREYTEAILFAVAVALGIRAFFVEAFKIPSPSMYPTLNVGDNIFVNKFIYGPLIPFTTRRLFNGRAARHGEVIVFIYPGDPSRDYIKRVVGVAGDRVRVFADGVVEVNGNPLPRCEVGQWSGDDGDGRRASEEGPRRTLYVEWHGDYHYLVLRNQDAADVTDLTGRPYAVQSTYTVPPGNVFVMGDNRDDSSDSRFWGPVPVQNIKGRAMWIWWSNQPGAGCGMRWNRFGQSILGEPRVPPALQSRYDACIRRGPEGSRPPRHSE